MRLHKLATVILFFISKIFCTENKKRTNKPGNVFFLCVDRYKSFDDKIFENNADKLIGRTFDDIFRRLNDQYLFACKKSTWERSLQVLNSHHYDSLTTDVLGENSEKQHDPVDQMSKKFEKICKETFEKSGLPWCCQNEYNKEVLQTFIFVLHLSVIRFFTYADSHKDITMNFGDLGLESNYIEKISEYIDSNKFQKFFELALFTNLEEFVASAPSKEELVSERYKLLCLERFLNLGSRICKHMMRQAFYDREEFKFIKYSDIKNDAKTITELNRPLFLLELEKNLPIIQSLQIFDESYDLYVQSYVPGLSGLPFDFFKQRLHKNLKENISQKNVIFIEMNFFDYFYKLINYFLSDTNLKKGNNAPVFANLSRELKCLRKILQKTRFNFEDHKIKKFRKDDIYDIYLLYDFQIDLQKHSAELIQNSGFCELFISGKPLVDLLCETLGFFAVKCFYCNFTDPRSSGVKCIDTLQYSFSVHKRSEADAKKFDFTSLDFSSLLHKLDLCEKMIINHAEKVARSDKTSPTLTDKDVRLGNIEPLIYEKLIGCQKNQKIQMLPIINVRTASNTPYKHAYQKPHTHSESFCEKKIAPSLYQTRNTQNTIAHHPWLSKYPPPYFSQQATLPSIQPYLNPIADTSEPLFIQQDLAQFSNFSCFALPLTQEEHQAIQNRIFSNEVRAFYIVPTTLPMSPNHEHPINTTHTYYNTLSNNSNYTQQHNPYNMSCYLDQTNRFQDTHHNIALQQRLPQASQYTHQTQNSILGEYQPPKSDINPYLQLPEATYGNFETSTANKPSTNIQKQYNTAHKSKYLPHNYGQLDVSQPPISGRNYRTGPLEASYQAGINPFNYQAGLSKDTPLSCFSQCDVSSNTTLYNQNPIDRTSSINYMPGAQYHNTGQYSHQNRVTAPLQNVNMRTLNFLGQFTVHGPHTPIEYGN